MQVLCKFDFLVQSDTHFCNGAMVNGPFLCCSLAFCATILNACWALVVLTGFFLSSGLVASFLVIVMAVVVVVDKNREKRERRLLMLSLL